MHAGHAAGPRIRSHRRRRAGLAVTPTGRDRLARLRPLTDAAQVGAAQRGHDRRHPLPRRPSRASRCGRRRISTRSSTRSASRGARSSRCACSASPTISSRSSRSAQRRRAAAGAVSAPARARRDGRVVQGRDRRRPAQDRPVGEVADNASPALASIRERLRRQQREAAHDARIVPARPRHVEVPAGAGRHRSQRPLRADGARRAPPLDSRHRARRVGQRRQPVPRAARDRRDQQRHRRARGAGGRGGPPHPAGADRRVPRRGPTTCAARSTSPPSST